MRCTAAGRQVAQLGILSKVTSDLQITNPQLTIDVDRDKAAALGITEDQVRNALYSQFGTRQVATLYTASNQYQVIIENDPKFQRTRPISRKPICARQRASGAD